MSARSFATARLMECWSHGLDALDGAGIAHVDSDRLRHIAHLGFITRGFAYRTRGLEPNMEPLRVELRLPSGAPWSRGPEDAPNVVRGDAGDFCRVATQRIHYRDTGLQLAGRSRRGVPPSRPDLRRPTRLRPPAALGLAPRRRRRAS